MATMLSRYGLNDNCPDWELVGQVGEYDIYTRRVFANGSESRGMLFVWGTWGFQKVALPMKQVLEYFKSVPHVCAWFRMEGYNET